MSRVFGNFGVSGSKFAVVKGGDGSTGGCTRWNRRMLVRGLRHRHAGERQATVKLDPLFAQHVHTDDYHVFLTEHDQHNT